MATTPSQTVGPFFAIELPYGDGPHVVGEATPGAIWLSGRIFWRTSSSSAPAASS